MITKNDEYFLEIVKSGSLSKAAEVLYMSQPSLTKHMHNLEASLGVPLFKRDVKPLRINGAGEIYYQYLLRSIASEKDLQNKLKEANSGKHGKLRIGIPTVFGEALLPLVIPRFHELYPDVRLEISEQSGINLHAAVAASELDIAFVHMPSIDVTTDYYSFSSEHIFLAVHEEALKGKKVYDIGNLDYDFRVMDFELLPKLLYILPKEGQMLHRYAMKFLSHHQITPQVLFHNKHCGNTSTNLKLAYEIDHSAAFIPEYTIRTLSSYMRSRFIFFYLEENELMWELLALYPKATSQSFFAREMIRLVRETKWELPLG